MMHLILHLVCSRGASGKPCRSNSFTTPSCQRHDAACKSPAVAVCSVHILHRKGEVTPHKLSMAQCAAEKFTKKLLGESEIETVLQRLDRLTQDEARVTVAQTLGVVYALVGNVKTVMEGAQRSHGFLSLAEHLFR